MDPSNRIGRSAERIELVQAAARALNAEDGYAVDVNIATPLTTALAERRAWVTLNRERLRPHTLDGVPVNVEEPVERDGPSCVWCGRELWRGDLTLDHVVPRSRGGHMVAEKRSWLLGAVRRSLVRLR